MEKHISRRNWRLFRAVRGLASGPTSAVLFFLCWALLLAATAAQAADDVDKVLYINSYHRGYKWSDDIEKAMMATLTRSGRNIEFSVEYLDSRRFEAKARMERVAVALEAKFANYPLDMVLLSDNAAFDFALRYRDRLFPGVPIVFCGYNSFRPEVLEGQSNITGVNEETRLSGTIELAVSIQPETTTLAFVTSTGEASSKRIADILDRDVFPKYRDRFQVVDIRDASLKTIHDRLAELPKTTAVFLSGQTSDMGKGRALSPVENGRRITPLSPFPVYTFWDFHLGTGVLGGRILTGSDQGRSAAELGLRVLDGADADDIPVIMRSPTSDIVDWSVMQRFGITEGQLPAGTEIINRTFTPWETYRLQIIGAIVVFAIETFLIAGLVIAVRQRRLALTALAAERDSLEKRVAERTEALNRSNQDLQAFAYAASHDLQEPLRTVVNFLQLLQRRYEGKLDEKADGYIGFAVDGAKRMSQMITDLLDYSRVDTRGAEPLPVDLGVALEAALAGLRMRIEEVGATITVDTLPVVWGDEAQFTRLLQNLVGNAVKYHHPDRNAVIRISATRTGAEWTVTIEDNGIGISPEHLDRVFGIFKRLHTREEYDGTGVGLALCKKIVERHAGRIWAESEPERGSRFRFSLPAAAAAPSPAERSKK